MIAASGLCKRVGAAEILRDVSLRVAPGEVAAIIGPSGGGKTTLLRCLNGLEAWDGGTLEVDGLRVGAAARGADRSAAFGRVRRKVGMVFQDFQLFPHWSVLGNVAEAPRLVLGLTRREAEDRARRLLDRVGLLAKIDAYPRSLSGGQRQRVAIARALAMEPRAILFDEPTSALDAASVGAVAAILGDLAAEGLALVVVTHMLPFARRVARTVHVLDSGRVVESGPAADLFDRPRHPATQALLRQHAPAGPTA